MLLNEEHPARPGVQKDQLQKPVRNNLVIKTGQAIVEISSSVSSVRY